MKNRNMHRIILNSVVSIGCIASLAMPITVYAQFENVHCFNNSNNEPSVELYKMNDPLGEYRVFMVLEELSKNDSVFLIKWHTYSASSKSHITQRWSMEGKRIEVERYPYREKPFTPPRKLKPPVLLPVKTDQTRYEKAAEQWLQIPEHMWDDIPEGFVPKHLIEERRKQLKEGKP
jgi:hypothetical protein